MSHPGYPVRIRGLDYPSAAAAARALGVTRTAVTHAIQRGRPDGAGTRAPSRGAPPRCAPARQAGPPSGLAGNPEQET